MNQPVILANFNLHVDLRIITSHLWLEGIAHRVVEQEQQQVLILADIKDLPKATVLFKRWQAGELQLANPAPISANKNLLVNAMKTPLTLFGALLLVAFFLWQQVDEYWYNWLPLGEFFWPNLRNNPRVILELGFLPVWRLSLLHFSFVHLLFNLMWWWILGQRIEQQDGRIYFLILIVAAGYLGNLAQWWLTGPAFGGASGITMAMLGWVGWRQLNHKQNYQLPTLLLPIMLGWILFSLFAEQLTGMNTKTAHGAHIAGLVTGLLLAMIVPRLSVELSEKP